MQYIEAPNNWKPQGDVGVFLAGGITGCPDWQLKLRRKLEHTKLTVINPRRESFPIDDINAAQAQIAWEHRHLVLANVISFWFCAETLNPIVLYELGAWTQRAKPIIVGIHPDYARKQDVEIQTNLAAPYVPIVYSLDDLAKEIVRAA